MKTILRILVILLVATLVAGGFTLAVNKTSSTASFGGDGGQPPVMLNGANGQAVQQMTSRPGGGFGSDRDGGASIGGFLGIFGTLAKLAGITAIVLLVEKGIGLLTNKKILKTA